MLPGQLAFTSLKHPKLEVLIYLSIYLSLTFLLTVAFSLFFDLLSIRDIQIQNNQNICSTRKKIRNFVYFFYFSQSKSRTNCCGFLKLISWRHLKIHFAASYRKISWITNILVVPMSRMFKCLCTLLHKIEFSLPIFLIE